MEYSKITIKDKAYPAQLKEITAPPPILYYRSSLADPFSELNKKPMIGVVGSRRCTQYGKRATEHIVKSLVRAGIVIVSGMAEGIDTAAHKAALEAGGETIAVLGSGIDEKVIYPKSNIKLAREIEKHGIVMSEFDPHSHSEAFFFPQRNRVISGLSLGVLVVEAQKKSGSLITANFALQQDREVFAVPGGIFWGTSDGTNNLIKQGAKPVTNAEDILEELNIANAYEESAILSSSDPTERKILQAILDKNGEGVHIDDIIKTSQLSANDVSACIIEMELDEKIKNLGGDYYVIK